MSHRPPPHSHRIERKLMHSAIYKIDHIIKTKSHEKKNSWTKDPHLPCKLDHFLTIFFCSWIVTSLTTITQNLKIGKSDVWFFIRFSTVRIFHAYISTSEGGGETAEHLYLEQGLIILSYLTYIFQMPRLNMHMLTRS